MDILLSLRARERATPGLYQLPDHLEPKPARAGPSMQHMRATSAPGAARHSAAAMPLDALHNCICAHRWYQSCRHFLVSCTIPGFRECINPSSYSRRLAHRPSQAAGT